MLVVDHALGTRDGTWIMGSRGGQVQKGKEEQKRIEGSPKCDL